MLCQRGLRPRVDSASANSSKPFTDSNLKCSPTSARASQSFAAINDSVLTDICTLAFVTLTMTFHYVHSESQNICAAAPGTRPYTASFSSSLCHSRTSEWLQVLRLLPKCPLVIMDTLTSLPVAESWLTVEVALLMLMWCSILLGRWPVIYRPVRNWLIVPFRFMQHAVSAATMYAGYAPSAAVTLYLPFCGLIQLWLSQFFWARKLNLGQELVAIVCEVGSVACLLALTVTRHPGFLSQPTLILMQMLACTALTVNLAFKQRITRRAAFAGSYMQPLPQQLDPSEEVSEACNAASRTKLAERSLLAAAPAVSAMTMHVETVQRLARPVPLCGYQSRATRTTLRVKMPFVHPHQLPPGWLAELNEVLKADANCCIANVGVREGCIELVLDLRPCISNSSSIGGWGESGCEDGGSAQLAVPLDEEAAVATMYLYMADILPHDPVPHANLCRDKLCNDVRSDTVAALPAPVLTQLIPLIHHLPANRDNSSAAVLTFTATGVDLNAPDVEVLVTCQGRYLPVTSSSCAGSSGSIVTVSCPLSALPRNAGMLQVVARRGQAVSDCHAVLVLKDASMVSELTQLPMVSAEDGYVQDVLQDFGQWLDMVQARLAAHAGHFSSRLAKASTSTATSSLDMSVQLGQLLQQADVEDAMLPTAFGLLQYFCELGWAQCACDLLSDLLNPNLGWSVAPSEMWRRLNAADTETTGLLFVTTACGHDGLARRLTAIAKSAGCYAAPSSCLEVQECPKHCSAAGSGQASPCSTTSSSSSSSYTVGSSTYSSNWCGGFSSMSTRGKAGLWDDGPVRPANRRASALWALLWGFPDPQMESKHRATLHRANSESAGLMVALIGLVVLLECVRVPWTPAGLLQATSVLASGLIYWGVYWIRTNRPHFYDNHPDAWPLTLLVARMLTAAWVMFGLPIRSGKLAMLHSGFGRVVSVTAHVAVPAFSGRARLPVALLVYGVTAGMSHAFLHTLGITLISLWSVVMCEVLPYLVGVAFTVYLDYKGRAELLRASASKKLQ